MSDFQQKAPPWLCRSQKLQQTEGFSMALRLQLELEAAAEAAPPSPQLLCGRYT